jgi:hypothetical protein
MIQWLVLVVVESRGFVGRHAGALILMAHRQWFGAGFEKECGEGCAQSVAVLTWME